MIPHALWPLERSPDAMPRIAARFALLVYVAIARCCYVCAEQPRSSLLPRLRYFERIPSVGKGLVEWASVNLSEAQRGV